jgi:TPR repeat protein
LRNADRQIGHTNEAFKWCSKGAKLGDEASMVNLAYLYEHGTSGAPLNTQKAVYWYKASLAQPLLNMQGDEAHEALKRLGAQ